MKKETIIPESRDPAFRDAVLKTPVGEKIPTCMQCGICAGSCPVSHEMDYTPRQLVRMVQLGLRKEVLSSNTIWICTTCFSCSVRCPRGIHPTELMEILKPMAIAQGIENKDSKFDTVFSGVVRTNGRASEFLLISKYGLMEPGIIKQLPFGISLFQKGKLPLSSYTMEDTKELDAIFRLGENSGEKEKELKVENKAEGKNPDGESKDTKEETKATMEKAPQENEKADEGEKK
jgi:heterodisulfide reductase subunit C